MTTALAPNDMLRQTVELLSSNPKGCTFATLVYRAKETNELAKHRLRLGVNFVNMYEKDRTLLSDLLPTFTPGCLQDIACRELLDSITESLTKGIGNNSRYTLRGKFYESPAFPGIKIMTPENAENPREIGLYITAVSDGKTVLEPGTHKHVNHHPLTVAKNEVRKMLRTNSIRTFRLANITRAAMFGEVLELEGAP